MRTKQPDIYLAYARVIHTTLRDCVHKIVVIIAYTIKTTYKMNEKKGVKRKKNENIDGGRKSFYISYVLYILISVVLWTNIAHFFFRQKLFNYKIIIKFLYNCTQILKA